MIAAPNPIVVRVFAKGGVDFVPLQQAIAHDLKCLMDGRTDYIPAIAGVFNNSIEAAAYVPTLKRTLRKAREKRAVEAAAATKPPDWTHKPTGMCDSPQDVPCYFHDAGKCRTSHKCAARDRQPEAASSGDRNNCAGNVPATGTEGEQQ